MYTLRTTDSLQEKGDALLFLLHFLSDMMQPMHVTQLVTDEYPNGDSGGLRYSLVGVSRFKNLHMLTDNPMIQVLFSWRFHVEPNCGGSSLFVYAEGLVSFGTMEG